MKKYILLFSFFFTVFYTFSQSDISGYIIGEKGKSTIVNLIRLDIGEDGVEVAVVIDTTVVNSQGYFHFSKELSTQPKFYYLAYKGEHKRKQSDKFLLGDKDTVFFQKSFVPFSKYKITSPSQKEWQRMIAFEKRIEKKKKYLDEIRTYSKDSLQILAVKLLSIRELDKKNLLDKDIALNQKYYISILRELKESDIDPNEYVFLELKLTKLHAQEIEKDFAMSKWINIALLGLIVIILLYTVKRKRPKPELASLSKQELTIKDLILQEKTNKEIAVELFISVSTVKTHITNIYQKLQVSNRNDLMKKFKNSTGTST